MGSELKWMVVSTFMLCKLVKKRVMRIMNWPHVGFWMVRIILVLRIKVMLKLEWWHLSQRSVCCTKVNMLYRRRCRFWETIQIGRGRSRGRWLVSLHWCVWFWNSSISWRRLIHELFSRGLWWRCLGWTIRWCWRLSNWLYRLSHRSSRTIRWIELLVSWTVGRRKSGCSISRRWLVFELFFRLWHLCGFWARFRWLSFRWEERLSSWGNNRWLGLGRFFR